VLRAAQHELHIMGVLRRIREFIISLALLWAQLRSAKKLFTHNQKMI
jgi:hypothetical protein